MWLLAIIAWTAAGSLTAQKASFPGAQSKVNSPDGHYVIENLDNDEEQPAHTLTVLDTRNHSSTIIYRYSRHVDVLWSPTSKAVVVNDYEGSNSSHPVVFEPPWSAATSVDLREKLVDLLRAKGGSKIILGNDHSYLLAQQWLNGKELVCELTAYGGANPKALSKRYVYTIGEGFRVLP